jgi:hypothetical protein
MSPINRGNGCPDKEVDMKVKELIAILEEQDQDANVLIMSQPNWPYAARRITRSAVGRDRNAAASRAFR